MTGEFVVVRTYSAGVHCGELVEFQGTCVILANARRIWSWSEAFSLNEVANKGVGEDSRISDPTEKIMLTQAIEVIVVTNENAKRNLQRSRNGA